MDVVRGAALSYQSKSSLALAFLTFGVRLDSVVVFGEDSESARPCVFPCVPRGSVCFIYFYGPGDREPVDGPTDKGREFIRFIFSPSLAAALAADSPFPPLPQKEKKNIRTQHALKKKRGRTSLWLCGLRSLSDAREICHCRQLWGILFY